MPFDNDTVIEKDHKTRKRHQNKKPKKYKVLIYNDDYTHGEFVIRLLREVFHRSYEVATRLTFTIHNHGVGVAGVYTREIAETKVDQATKFAHGEGHPLHVDMEEE